MSDRKIIYVDDAIEALEKVARLFPYRVPGDRDTYDRYNEAWNDAIGRAEIEIEALPSAQPEIIQCGECKYAEVADPEDSQDGYVCQFHRGSIWFSGSYCSWAERREDG